MLLIEMFLGAVPTSSTIFQIDFTKDMAEGTFKSKYVLLVFALEEHKIMCAMRALLVDLVIGCVGP
jgi:thioredoxin-related protein